MTDLSKDEQDEMVVQIITGVETMTEEEIEELYGQLDIDHQMEVDQGIRDYADNAVGVPWWDSDD